MRRLPNWTIFSLLSITVLAIMLRLLKLYEFTIWGSDSGEHFFLLNTLINKGQLQLTYTGWGLAYPFFQGMHIISSGFAKISGSSAFFSLIYITPIIAGLSVLLIFCIAYRVFRDARIGLMAAGFLAVVMPHVFTTSHPMPGSVGSLLLLTCIFLWLKTYDNRKFLIIFGVSALALVITHHMSTYFLIITLTAAILVRELLQHPKDYTRTKIDFGILTFLISITLFYWLFYAESFQKNILLKGIPIPIWSVLPLAYLLIGILYLIIHFRRKWKWQYKSKTLKTKSLAIRAAALIICGIVITIISAFTIVPGTEIRFGFLGVLYFIPIIIFFSFTAMALAICEHYKDGLVLFSWFGAICVSIIYSAITKSQELLTYRHLPYVFESISVLTSTGLVKFFDIVVHKKDTSYLLEEDNIELIAPVKRPKQLKSSTLSLSSTSTHQVRPPWRYRITAAGFVICLMVICATFSYPPQSVVGGFEEGTTDRELESCFWVRESMEDGITVATDHRMSSMMFGFANVNSSWEYAPKTLHAATFDEMRKEAIGVTVPAGWKRLDYVVISDSIKSGVALEQWVSAKPMAKSAVTKFETNPFLKLYDNGEVCIYRIGNYSYNES